MIKRYILIEFEPFVTGKFKEPQICSLKSLSLEKNKYLNNLQYELDFNYSFSYIQSFISRIKFIKII